MRNRYRMMPAVVALLAITACGAGNDADTRVSTSPSARETKPTPTRSASPSPTRTPTPTPTVTPTPTPTEAPKPKRAKDGRDLDACRDRVCEVEVRAGDTIRFASKFEARTFTVHDITSGQVAFSATDDYDSGGFSGWIGGDGTVETADVHVDVFRTDSGRVILRISPRK